MLRHATTQAGEKETFLEANQIQNNIFITHRSHGNVCCGAGF
jgi:hypothetical protein